MYVQNYYDVFKLINYIEQNNNNKLVYINYIVFNANQ